MNIIASWNAAKIGQKIKWDHNEIVKTEKSYDLTSWLYKGVMSSFNNLSGYYVLGDGWQIVKEKKRVDMTWADAIQSEGTIYEMAIPADAKVTIEWEE